MTDILRIHRLYLWMFLSIEKKSMSKNLKLFYVKFKLDPSSKWFSVVRMVKKKANLLREAHVHRSKSPS